jgi:hypothetical protein
MWLDLPKKSMRCATSFSAKSHHSNQLFPDPDLVFPLSQWRAVADHSLKDVHWQWDPRHCLMQKENNHFNPVDLCRNAYLSEEKYIGKRPTKFIFSEIWKVLYLKYPGLGLDHWGLIHHFVQFNLFPSIPAGHSPFADRLRISHQSKPWILIAWWHCS